MMIMMILRLSLLINSNQLCLKNANPYNICLLPIINNCSFLYLAVKTAGGKDGLILFY